MRVLWLRLIVLTVLAVAMFGRLQFSGGWGFPCPRVQRSERFRWSILFGMLPVNRVPIEWFQPAPDPPLSSRQM